MMISPEVADLWNAALELGGAYFISRSIRKLYRDKIVRGFAWEQVAFYAMWGVLNLFYYPAMGSWYSFYAGIAVTVTNLTYTAMLIYYTWRERRDGKENLAP